MTTILHTQLTHILYFVYTHVWHRHIVYCIHTSVCWLHSLLRCANMCLFVYVYTHTILCVCIHVLYIATQTYIFCIVYTRKLWKEPYIMAKEPCMIRKKNDIKQTDIYRYKRKEQSPEQRENISWQRLCPPLYMAVFTWQRAVFPPSHRTHPERSWTSLLRRQIPFFFPKKKNRAPLERYWATYSRKQKRVRRGCIVMFQVW